MDILTRKQAVSTGSITYYTGKVCKHGHLSKRNTKSGCCMECAKGKCKYWYNTQMTTEEGKNILSLYGKRYRHNNIESKKKQTRNYYYKNQIRCIQQSTQWICDNPTVAKHHRELYRNKHPEKLAANGAKRRAAKLKRTPKWLTKDDFKQIEILYKESSNQTKSTGIKHVVDHYYPLQGETVSGLHCPANLQVITESENAAKSNKHPDIFYEI